MLYISFAQIPRATPHHKPSSWTIKFSVRVTTDLKDRSLSGPITLKVAITTKNPTSRYAATFVDVLTQQWTPRNVNDVCKIEFNLPQKLASPRVTIRVIGAARTRPLTESIDLMYNIPKVPLLSRALPPVVSVFSAGLDLTNENTSTAPLQGRTLRGPSDHSSRLKLWEDLGYSLARHMWDGGIALAAWLDMQMRIDHTAYFQTKIGAGLRVLEIGCGIGTVGIHLAQLLPNTRVTLTDLADAGEMVKLNIDEALLAEGSEVTFSVMDWEDDLYPDTIVNQALDLIIISECFYNTTMAEALIRKLQGVMGLHAQNLDTPILISWKCRHPDEQLFKSLMEKHFKLTFQDSIPMPQAEADIHIESDPITEEPISINVFVYRGKTTGDACPPKVSHLPLRFLWEDSLSKG